MRAALDARKLDDFGIGTHIRGLLAGFEALGAPEELVVYGPPGHPRPSPAAPGIEWRVEAAPPYSVAELVRLARRARQDRVEVFHAPHYVCPPRLPCPAVVTIHDLIHLRFPVRHRHLLAPLYARVMLRLAVRRAARLITVSESTRRDLVARLHAPADKIRVIPNGVGPEFHPAPAGAGPEPALAALGLGPPYFLWVGNPLPHKNLPGLLRAYAALPAATGRLVLAGVPPAARERVRQACAAAGVLDRVSVLAPVAVATMPVLYRGALALVCPSLWEGFGLPALEAMACGTPVVVADRGGLPEVVGDAALLVDPTNVDALREAMYTLAVQEPLRAALRVAGPARARAFSWRHVAEATVAVYREAVAGTPGQSRH